MIVGLDFETFYSREYSLRKMSELEYILDPQFETIGCAVKIDRAPSEWIVGHKALAEKFSRIPWDKVAMLSHNIRFDGAILHWHFGHVAGLYLDTLSMARAMTHSVTGRSSLDAVARYLGIGVKGGAIHNAIGKRLRDFSWDELREYGEYCVNDNELCRQIFDRMAPRFPQAELQVIDLTQRMYILPQLRLNRATLAAHLDDVRAKKEKVFATVAGIDRAVFSSNAQFAELLEKHGVDVPVKPSPADPNKMIPALARNDRGFKELCEDETQPLLVQAMLAARRESKSTIEETRTEKMLRFAGVRWPDGSDGWLPVPLRYYGAHTGRFSGDGGFNLQNLRRDSEIRRAIEAPEDYVVVTRDASQIEARMVAWLAGQADLVADFAAGVDIYSKFASTVFSRAVSKADKVERFIGKTCLAAGTLVVTNRGLIPIEEVTPADKLWDGIEWVSHEGLIAQGLRETLTLSGVSLTPDHRVWCGTHWKDAASLALGSDGHFPRLVLEAANSPSPDTCLVCGEVFKPLSCDAIAEPRSTQSIGTTFALFALLDATRVRSELQQTSDGGNTLTRCQTMLTELGCSIASPPQSRAAAAPPPKHISTTAAAASECMSLGSTTVVNFSGMCRRCLDGMTHHGIWTGSIMTGGMNPAISASQRAVKMPATSESSLACGSASRSLKPVFDLANAGPRHRFTIATRDGLVIVSNCILGLGYGMGAPKFQNTVYIGNGGISVVLDPAESERIVRLYRKVYDQIPQIWGSAQNLLAHVWMASDQGRRMGLWGQLPRGGVTAGFNCLWLPNGMPIAYPNLRVDNTSGPTNFIYDGPYHPKTLFGGKVVENVSQALARIVITDIMRRIWRDHRRVPALQVHDSLAYVVHRDEAADFDRYLSEQFSIVPEWARGLPLASEGGYGPNLAAAEGK